MLVIWAGAAAFALIVLCVTARARMRRHRYVTWIMNRYSMDKPHAEWTYKLANRRWLSQHRESTTSFTDWMERHVAEEDLADLIRKAH